MDKLKIESKRTGRTDRLKDRGDMQRRKLPEKEILKQPPDRGDLHKPIKDKKTNRPQNKVEKEVSPQKKSENEVSPQKIPDNEVITQSANQAKTTRKVAKPEVEFRQRVRDRYTLKPKGMLKFQSRKEEQFSFVRDELSQKEYFSKESKDLSEPAEKGKTSSETKSERSTKLRKPARRKAVPVTKHAQIIPKVVTFVERNARPQLRAPELLNEFVKPHRIVKRLPTMPENKRLKTTKDRVETPQSPSTISQAAILSPPTEVAKWTSPSSKHTMPYYEAWVDTTLAAISKISNKDKLYEKQRMLESFHSQLQRCRSPELVYKNTDERCVGTIRVRQR